MSLRNRANRQLDDLFNPKPKPEFVSPLSNPIAVVTPDGAKVSIPKDDGTVRVLVSDRLNDLIAKKARKDELDKKAEVRSDLKKAEKEKRALREKDRRKKQREAIKNIKSVLAIPVEERIEQARLKRESRRIPALSDGLRMTDFDGKPIGPRITTGGIGTLEIDLIDQAGPQLILTDSDSEGVLAQSAKCEGSGSDADYKSGDEDKTFHAELDVDASFRQRVMHHIREEYISDIGPAAFPNSIINCTEDVIGEVGEVGEITLPAAVCRLCIATIPLDYVDGHIVNVHGDESEPDHDETFGNIIDQMASHLIREDRKIAKRPRLPLEQFLQNRKGKQSAKEDEARREGLVKGPYVYDPVRRKHVQSWIPTKSVKK